MFNSLLFCLINKFGNYIRVGTKNFKNMNVSKKGVKAIMPVQVVIPLSESTDKELTEARNLFKEKFWERNKDFIQKNNYKLRVVGSFYGDASNGYHEHKLVLSAQILNQEENKDITFLVLEDLL